MRPGVTILPVTSRTLLPERLAPIAATLPPAKAMSVTLSSPCDGSMTRPPFKTRSFIVLLSHLAHGFRQRPRARQPNAIEAEPIGHQPQFLAQWSGHVTCLGPGLEVGRMDQQGRRRAIRLEVET